MTLSAYGNDPALKEYCVSEAQRHRELDEIAQGTYHSIVNGKPQMCLIGCIVQTNDHAEAARRYGVSVEIMHLADVIHEGLADGEYQMWPERFSTAIATGSDTTLKHHEFYVRLLTDESCGVIRHANTNKLRGVIQNVSDLHQRAANRRRR